MVYVSKDDDKQQPEQGAETSHPRPISGGQPEEEAGKEAGEKETKRGDEGIGSGNNGDYVFDDNEAVRRGFKPTVSVALSSTRLTNATSSESTVPLHHSRRHRHVQPGAEAVGAADPAPVAVLEEDGNTGIEELPIQAYPVAAQPLVRATLLDRLDDKKRRLAIVGILALFTVAASIGIGLGVSRANDDSSSVRVITDPELGELLVSFVWTLELYGQIHEARQWKKTVDGKEVRTTNGNALDFGCLPIPCEQGTGYCHENNDKPYEEGCCLGEDCPDDTKCGGKCPLDACTPDFAGCVSEECFTCKKGTNGQELYRINAKIATVFCMDYGTSTTTNGDPYDWVTYCSEIVRGGEAEADILRNFGNGEYQCVSVRKGEQIKEYVAWIFPCQYLQLGECGCGPLDMTPFDLPAPTKPCETQDDCRILCSDATLEDEESYDLCRAFGGVEFWEGNNWANISFFYDPVAVLGEIYATEVFFEIDIFGY